MIAPVSYQLKQQLKIDMTGLLHLSIDTPNGASKVIVDGDLQFRQDSPIVFEKVQRLVYQENPISVSLLKKNSLTELIEKYYSRTGKFVAVLTLDQKLFTSSSST